MVLMRNEIAERTMDRGPYGIAAARSVNVSVRCRIDLALLMNSIIVALRIVLYTRLSFDDTCFNRQYYRMSHNPPYASIVYIHLYGKIGIFVPYCETPKDNEFQLKVLSMDNPYLISVLKYCASTPYNMETAANHGIHFPYHKESRFHLGIIEYSNQLIVQPYISSGKMGSPL